MKHTIIMKKSNYTEISTEANGINNLLYIDQYIQYSGFQFFLNSWVGQTHRAICPHTWGFLLVLH